MTNKFDPFKHRRRSIRLKGWDYASAAAYFVTICTYQRQNLFANEQFYRIVENSWQNIPDHPHARFVKLDEWIVMPNHLHGIIIITETICRDVEYESTTSPDKDILISDASSLRSAPAGSLGVIIGNFKSVVTRRINRIRKSQGGKAWQRGYYERIVRNDRELNAIRQYICDNPQRWSEDREDLDNVIHRMDQMR